jgi:hypothetical protein
MDPVSGVSAVTRRRVATWCSGPLGLGKGKCHVQSLPATSHRDAEHNPV